jgi:hypothetical protein
MTTYDELEAFASAGLFHNDPTEAHSASSQIDVDCALATAANNVRTTTDGTIVRRNTETNVFTASALFDRIDFTWLLRIAYARVFNIFDSFRSGLHRGSLMTCLSRMNCQWPARQSCATVQNKREMAQRLFVALWIKVQKSGI